MSNTKNGPKASPYLSNLSDYQVQEAAAPTDLKLNANEGIAPPLEVLDILIQSGPEIICRYAKPSDLERQLAKMWSLDPAQLLVTAGGDDAIDRIAKAYLPPGRDMICPVPTFEMIPKMGRISGGNIIDIPWPEGPYPTEAVLEQVDGNTGIILMISPNNPTGAVAASEDLRHLSEGAPDALILLDQAYSPFADVDLTSTALELPNVVAVHTLSKAWGMAGLRVGYAIGRPEIIESIRVAGMPYPVSSLSLAVASRWLATGSERVKKYVKEIRREREDMYRLLEDLGARPLRSQANFLFLHPRDRLWLRDALAGMGISVRLFEEEAEFEGGLRVTCPGETDSFQRLMGAFETILSPEALLFDMDGVLADVSRSYREVILQVGRSYGIELTAGEIAAAKAEENANNDWEVTRRLLERHGVKAELGEVTARFEALYHGTASSPGLYKSEKLIPSIKLLERLSKRLPLAIVTGRPRLDAERFLDMTGIAPLFKSLVCMGDSSPKPDPAPVKLAMQQLGIERAWMVGDAPDDIRAARSARVLPLGMPAPGDASTDIEKCLSEAGAARILTDLRELEDYLP